MASIARSRAIQTRSARMDGISRNAIAGVFLVLDKFQLAGGAATGVGLLDGFIGMSFGGAGIDEGFKF